MAYSLIFTITGLELHPHQAQGHSKQTRGDDYLEADGVHGQFDLPLASHGRRCTG